MGATVLNIIQEYSHAAVDWVAVLAALTALVSAFAASRIHIKMHREKDKSDIEIGRDDAAK